MSQREDFFVQVTLSPEQARVVVNALDVLSRIHIGQFNIVREEFLDRDFDSDAVNRLLFAARHLVFPELGGGEGYSYGIRGCPSRKGKVAWDVLQVIRQVEAFARRPEGGYTVSFNDPMFVSDSEPRPTAKAVNILDRLSDL